MAKKARSASTTRSSADQLRSPRDSLVKMTEMVLPQHTNSLGAVFGGILMSWIDIAAAISAARHAGRTCVTASIDQLHFLRPIKKGCVVNIEAKVTAVHHTSCEVIVNVEGENLLTRERFLTSQALMTFVALNDEGRPTPMPPLSPENEEDRLNMAQAGIRRKHRIQLKKELEKISRKKA